jgi:hypothetical protein
MEPIAVFVACVLVAALAGSMLALARSLVRCDREAKRLEQAIQSSLRSDESLAGLRIVARADVPLRRSRPVRVTISGPAPTAASRNTIYQAILLEVATHGRRFWLADRMWVAAARAQEDQQVPADQDDTD